MIQNHIKTTQKSHKNDAKSQKICGHHPVDHSNEWSCGFEPSAKKQRVQGDQVHNEYGKVIFCNRVTSQTQWNCKLHEKTGQEEHGHGQNTP